MKKGLKIILILFAIATISIYLTIFILAKQKKIFINKWFVDEKTQAENFINTVGENLEGRLLPAVDMEYYLKRKF